MADRQYSSKAVGLCTGIVQIINRECGRIEGKNCYIAVSVCGLWTSVCACSLWQQHQAGKAGKEGDEQRDSFLGGRKLDRLCLREKGGEKEYKRSTAHS